MAEMKNKWNENEKKNSFKSFFLSFQWKVCDLLF